MKEATMGAAHNLQSCLVGRRNIIVALATNTEFKAAENIFTFKSCNMKNINAFAAEIINDYNLYDDADFRKNLIYRYPHAIGGEIEGIGLATSCIRYNISWILIKAVSDWCIYKNDDAQYGAALNSIQFCRELINLL
jgi:nucleoside phosphorylase